MCRPFFFLPITATQTIVVVENIELDPSNNTAREGLRLPTYGQLTKKSCPLLSDYIMYYTRDGEPFKVVGQI